MSAAAEAMTPFTIGLEFMNKETDGSGQYFGCLKFATAAFPEGYKQKGKYRIHISLDVSTSMRTDRRIDLAKETVVKMVEYLTSTANENPGLQFWITLTTFSTDARVVIRNEKVTSDTLSLITSTVQRIQLENSTNFEASFLLDRAIMQEQATKDQEDGDTADIVTLHIQMTDGEITAGNKDETHLKSLLVPEVEHVFIGYGADHKAACLINLSKVNSGSSYMFLDHPTKMGAMFAQIFCPHLFTAVSEITIALTGAKFLDVEQGCEMSTMFLSRVATETTKRFHILTDQQEEDQGSGSGDDVVSSVYDYTSSSQAVSVKVTFRSFDNKDLDQPPNFPFRTVFDVVSATTHSIEVQKERLRWKVMILMKDAKDMKHREHEEFARHNRYAEYDYETRQYVEPMKEEKDALIRRANELKDEIKQFGEFHDIAEDEMLKDLTTDLVICICAIPSCEHGLMYVYSRFRSCADETPSAVTDLTPLDEHVNEFVSSSGYDAGDDQLFSCGGSNEHVLHRQRSGTTSAGFDLLNRAMSQSPTSSSSGPAFDSAGNQGIRRARSSYRQSSHGDDVVGTDDDLVVIPNDLV
jgi:hypothetical protein